MTDFTKGKVSDVPRAAHSGPAQRGLTRAIRELDGDDALFIPTKDGDDLAKTQVRVSSAAQRCGLPGSFGTRQDKEKDGVWVFLRRNGAA